MHGLGNDFVIIDARGAADPMTPALARAIGDRRRGVGFDQLAVIFPDDEADARIVFWNSDGSTAGACGNASRCLARLMMEQSGKSTATLRTARGLLACRDAGDGLVEVNMGAPEFGWRDVPLAREMDTATLDLPGGPGAVSMGNPHAVLVVDDVDTADVAGLGPKVESHPDFPRRVNAGFMQVVDRDSIRLRVFERGVGETLACGTGACAAVVYGINRGWLSDTVTVELPGGKLSISWAGPGEPVLMTGPTAVVFEGTIKI